MRFQWWSSTMVLSILILSGGSALAASVDLGSFGGTTGSDSASADFSYDSTTNQLSVLLQNLTPAGATHDAGDLLTGLMFSFDAPGVTGVSYASGAAVDTGGRTYIDVGVVGDPADGEISTPNPMPTDMSWSIDDTSKINPIPAGSFLLSFSPQADRAIIGQEESDGNYSTAAGSIKGNGPHNPFTYLGGLFALDVTGWTSGVQIASVTFFFGTDLERSTTPPDTSTSVPLPTGAWMGFACLGLLFVVRGVRKRRHQAA